jgi:hypothetical protein
MCFEHRHGREIRSYNSQNSILQRRSSVRVNFMRSLSYYAKALKSDVSRSERLVGISTVALSFRTAGAFWRSKIATMLRLCTGRTGSAKGLAHLRNRNLRELKK